MNRKSVIRNKITLVYSPLDTNDEAVIEDRETQKLFGTTLLESDKEQHATRSRSFTVPTSLNLPYKHKIPQDTMPQLFVASSRLQEQDRSILHSLQQQNDQKRDRNRAITRRLNQIPSAKESISDLNTMIMFAFRPGELGQHQQDIFINAMVEDIALRDTWHLPAVTLKPEKHVQLDQRQAVVSTAGRAAIAGAGDIINAILRFLTNVVMTNIVSPSVYGTFVTAYTFATILGSIATFGLDSAMLRFLSTYRAKGEYGLAAGLVRFVVWVTLVSGILCGALFYCSATILARLVYHKDAYSLPFKEVAMLVPLIALQLVLASGLTALKAIKWKVYVDRLIQPGLALVLIGGFHLFGLRLEALILAMACGFLTSVITGQVLLRKASKQLVRDAVPRFEPKTWLRFALPLFFNSIIQNVLNSTDILFLAAFATAAQVGLYAAADRASYIIAMPLLALNIIFSPLIAEYYARGEHEQLANLSKVVTKWSFSLSLPVFLFFCIFHDAILSIFSREYTLASVVLIILSFGNLVYAGTGSTAMLLIMTGHTRVILANSVVAITINIGLALLLVPRFNIIGAAVTAMLVVVFLNVAYLIEVYWILKTHTFRWDMLKPMVAGGVASMLGLLLLRVVHVGYGFRALFEVLGLVIPFMLVYVLMLGLLRFSKEDMMVLDAVRAKFVKKQSA
jgi:O-antigen/teichoic acid export membrane protein